MQNMTIKRAGKESVIRSFIVRYSTPKKNLFKI